MAAFDISVGDPRNYRDEILGMWQRFLPDTPPERFEWLLAGNPAGPALWFMAFERETRQLSGALSLVPRTVYCDGRPLRAGILGDFMVDDRHRAFGPGLLLPRHVAKAGAGLGFDFLYTVPNKNAEKVMHSAGFGDRSLLHTLAKPVAAKLHLRRYIPPVAAAFLGPVIDLAVRLASLEEYYGRSYTVSEEDPISPAFDELWERAKGNIPGLLGDRSSAFLEWKHGRNPLGALRPVTLRKRHQEAIEGYLFYRVEGPCLTVGDLLLVDEDGLFPLVRTVVHLARRRGCQAVYVKTGSPSLLSRLRRCLFLDAKADSTVLVLGGALGTRPWHFLPADQNI